MRNLTRALLFALPLTALAANEAPTPELKLAETATGFRLFRPDEPALGVFRVDPPVRVYTLDGRGRVTVVEQDPPRLRRSMPRCFHASCPVNSCADAVIPPGECCPRCPSDRPGGPVGGSRSDPAR